jgi:uncharacterized protein with HEPN domain
MVARRPIQRFRDILDAINDLRAFSSGMNQNMLETDRLKRFAIERAFLIIAEAATKLGDLAEKLEPGVPWHDIRALGNVLRHDYDGVDVKDLWYSLQNDLEPLREACERALEYPDLQGSD